MPKSTIAPSNRCIKSNFTFVNKGSSKAIIIGNVNRDNILMATLDSFNA